MNEKSDMKFIKTSDKTMREKLILAGFTEIGEPVNGLYCFINNGNKLTFDIGNKDVFYTNVLCL